MSAFEQATNFFHACESLKGWEGCKDHVAEGAAFSAQCEPLVDIHTVKDYCEWVAGLGKGPLKGCVYEIHASAWDEGNKTAVFFATYHAKHTGDGGPVPPTQNETHSHYVYVLTMNADDKVERMVKIWNAPLAMKELGWM